MKLTDYWRRFQISSSLATAVWSVCTCKGQYVLQLEECPLSLALDRIHEMLHEMSLTVSPPRCMSNYLHWTQDRARDMLLTVQTTCHTDVCLPPYFLFLHPSCAPPSPEVQLHAEEQTSLKKICPGWTPLNSPGWIQQNYLMCTPVMTL